MPKSTLTMLKLPKSEHLPVCLSPLLQTRTFREAVAPRHRRFMYYGYAFESFSTWHEPLLLKEQHAERDRVRSWGGDVDTNVQYCSVVKTKIDAERMIIGGEVDCCRGKLSSINGNFRSHCRCGCR